MMINYTTTHWGNAVVKMRHSLLLLAAMLLFSFNAEASHYRYGNMTWQLVPGQPNTVDITIQQAWRRSFGSFGNPNVGDVVNTGSLSIPGQASRTISLNVTAINPAEDWFFGTFTTRVTFPGNGNYTVSYSGCCRIGSLQNNANGSQRNETVVTIDSLNPNNAPQSTISPIINLQQGLAGATFQLPATDSDGDPLTYRIATNAETAVTPLSGITIDATGLVTYSTIGKSQGDLYQAQLAVEDPSGAKTVLDFIIRIVQQSNPPQFDYTVTPTDGFTYNVNPGDPIDFKVEAFDLDAGDVVTLNAVGTPPGASYSPALPTAGGNPDSTEFSWTPGPADAGTYVINFTAEDNNGVQTQSSVSIVVSSKPRFDVPPTPVQGTHLVFAPGDLINFTAQASDFDPDDSVQIVSVTGKDYNTNNPVPLYSGASFSPLPTPEANPTAGNFNWTPMASQWGHKHILLTAEDELGETVTHEVSILVNTTPVFNTMPDSCVNIDDTYMYMVGVTDPDTAYGDSIDLFAFNLPAWLSFTDNEDGTGVLSGSPSQGDGGTYQVIIEAQDVHHHSNPGGIPNQTFDINVGCDSVVEEPDTSDCVPVNVVCESDGSWMKSTYTEQAPWGGNWSGAMMLPAAATYSMPVMLGQPYSWGTFEPVDNAPIIIGTNNVTFYRKEVNIANPQDVKMRLRATMDDGLEVYVNGHLLVREENSDQVNWEEPVHDILYEGDGTITNGNMGNQAFDVVTPADLDTILQAGANEFVVALYNLRASSNRGGFSMIIEAEVQCPATDSCVSDSTWDLSTVVTQAPWGGDWFGVANVLPHDSTYTLKAVEGQPYPWGGMNAVEGSTPIKAENNVRYYRKKFNVTDKDDVDARIRMFMDDGCEIYLNGHMIAREENSIYDNWYGVNHDLMYNSDGTVDNGANGNQAFEYAANADLDSILVNGENTLVIALYNLRSGANKGGFSFRLDMTKNGAPVLIPVKSSARRIAQSGTLELYPNPTTGNVTVDINSNTELEKELVVTDLNGKVILTETLHAQVMQYTFDVSPYPAGVYLVRVKTGDRVDVGKVMKQ